MKFRKIERKDVQAVVAMIANDKLGKQREDYQDPLPQVYFEAFEDIDNNPHIELMVLEENDELIGTFQLTFMRHLTYKGGIRAQIEAVRVREDQRGRGLGETMMKWAIQRAKEKGAHLVQLTTDKKRGSTLEFYEKLGFVASHEGLKLHF